ncbi:hypothetical protein [uncultured Amnibacterium sp.]|uniref:hypothetical protein n=1 Tax=uncultured Amnibacterium sp. TaxID=1631851 RepID=UPI0035CC522D
MRVGQPVDGDGLPDDVWVAAGVGDVVAGEGDGEEEGADDGDVDGAEEVAPPGDGAVDGAGEGGAVFVATGFGVPGPPV